MPKGSARPTLRQAKFAWSCVTCLRFVKWIGRVCGYFTAAAKGPMRAGPGSGIPWVAERGKHSIERLTTASLA